MKTANVLWTTLMVGAWIGAGVATAAGPTMPTEKNFLMKAAGGQMAEIALGKMATERAESEKVKQFGSRMVEDHQKAKQEVTQLASQAGVELPASMPAMHKEKAQQLSQLSGKEFDRAYIKDMLRDHMKDVVEFEHSAMELKDPKIKQWASATLPVLKEHLQMVKSLASDLGIASQ